MTNDSKARPFIPARPTVYNGVKMRSRLEATFAQHIDGLGWDWTYEPNCFASPEGQYLPDFLVRWPHDGGAAHLYYEVKPSFLLEDLPAVRGVQRRMEIIWASEPDAQLRLIFPETWHSYWTCRSRRSKRWFYDAPGDRGFICDICRLSQWPGKGCSSWEEGRLEAIRYGWQMVDRFNYCPPCAAGLIAEFEAGQIPSESA